MSGCKKIAGKGEWFVDDDTAKKNKEDSEQKRILTQ
jgi:hypothetical protein